ncbi:hypothetical protein GLYMA_04G045451v4 [Glycine max]|nr:hypothetical protein GLYMA_04G045451v4 [Glycine max]KAH1109768.1 hypothetical protein GYH30_008926 [Glycine max]
MNWAATASISALIFFLRHSKFSVLRPLEQNYLIVWN